MSYECVITHTIHSSLLSSMSTTTSTETFRCSAYNHEWRSWLEALNAIDKANPCVVLTAIGTGKARGVYITGRETSEVVVVIARLFARAFISFHSASGESEDFRFSLRTIVKHLGARKRNDIVDIFHSKQYPDDLQIVSRSANDGQISRINVHLLEPDRHRERLPETLLDDFEPLALVVLTDAQTAEWRQAIKGMRELTASTDNIDTDPHGIIQFKLTGDKVVLSPRLGDEKHANISHAMITITAPPQSVAQSQRGEGVKMWTSVWSNFKAPLLYKFFSFANVNPTDELVLYYRDHESPLCARYPLRLPALPHNEKQHKNNDSGYIEVTIMPMIEDKDEMEME